MKEGVFRKTLALDFFVFLFFYIQAALALHMSVERYPGKNNLVVCNNAKLCIHSRHCVTQLTNVFKPNTPGAWIDPNAASREAVISTIVRCPSGALTYETTDGTPGEQAPSVNIVRTWENGPYEFRGDLRIEGQEPSFRATLCRCGRSKNKPFCDKSHALAGFYATGEPETNPSDALPHRDGLLHIIPQKDGPYVVKGSLELCAASGRTVGRTAYTQLCRCGASQTKPFCDGSHAREGFKSDNGHEIPHDAGRHNAPAYREQHATTLEGVLAEQYSNQLQLLERTGLLKEGEMIDIGGKTHRLPSVAEFTERLRSKKEFIESKYREGFTRLLVVPFGAPLSRFQYRKDASSAVGCRIYRALTIKKRVHRIKVPRGFYAPPCCSVRRAAVPVPISERRIVCRRLPNLQSAYDQKKSSSNQSTARVLRASLLFRSARRCPGSITRRPHSSRNTEVATPFLTRTATRYSKTRLTATRCGRGRDF